MSDKVSRPNTVIRALLDGTHIEISLVNAFGSPKLHAFLLPNDGTRIAVSHRDAVSHIQDPLLEQCLSFNERRYGWESDTCRELCCDLGISLSYVRPFYDESAFSAASAFEDWYHDNASTKRELDSEKLQLMFQCLTALDEKLPQQQRTLAFETAKEMLGLVDDVPPSFLTQSSSALNNLLNDDNHMQDIQSQIARDLYRAADERFLGASEVVIHFLPCPNFHKGRATFGVFRPYGSMAADIDVTGFWRMPGVAVQPVTMNWATRYVVAELMDRHNVQFLPECDVQSYLENQGRQHLEKHKWMRTRQSPAYRLEVKTKPLTGLRAVLANLFTKTFAAAGDNS